MNTYKNSILLAAASKATSIKRSIWEDNRVYLEGDEGARCSLQWRNEDLPCRSGLECRDMGPDSIDGFGLCDDPEKLGDFFDWCDDYGWNGDRIAGCKDEYECRDFDFYGLSLGRRCSHHRSHVGWGEQCGLIKPGQNNGTECISGLVCEQVGQRGYICQDPPARLNFSCGVGLNQSARPQRPFPRCQDGLVCTERGPSDPPGYGQEATKICKIPQPKGYLEQCSFDSECDTGLECRFGWDIVTIPGQHPGNVCQHVFGQEGDECGETHQPDCDVGLECRERVFEGLGFSLDTCQQQVVKSEDFSDSVMIHFENWSGREVQLYWYDYEGTPKPYVIIQPDEKRVQQTFATHPWEARVTDGSGVELSIDGMPVYTTESFPTEQHLEIRILN